MCSMRSKIQWVLMIATLAIVNVGCGKYYAYTPAGVSHNTDRFGHDTGKIEKEINESFDKMSERFNLMVERYMGLKIGNLVSDLLQRNDLDEEDLQAFFDESDINDEERDIVLKEYELLMAALMKYAKKNGLPTEPLEDRAQKDRKAIKDDAF